MSPGRATFPRPSTVSQSAPGGSSRITSPGGPMAAMRSPEITTEAGAWTASSPRSRPRSGPDPFGETAASRSWTRSETSATFFLPGVDAAPGDPRCRHDPAPGPEDQGGGEIFVLHVGDLRVLKVNIDEVRGIPRLQTLAPPTRRKQP